MCDGILSSGVLRWVSEVDLDALLVVLAVLNSWTGLGNGNVGALGFMVNRMS